MSRLKHLGFNEVCLSETTDRPKQADHFSLKRKKMQKTFKIVVVWVFVSLFWSINARSEKVPEAVIFDTDTAYFADDGAALAMLLARSDLVDIKGITIVAGNEHPVQGVEYIAHIIDLMKKHTPIYIGAKGPLVNDAKQVAEMKEKYPDQFVSSFLGALSGEAPAAEKVKPPSGGKFSKNRPQEKNAVNYIIETLEKSEGQMTFVALGPMTNLAKALTKKPSIAHKISKLIFMGGNVHVLGNATKAAEFNFWFDPEAAQVVLNAPIPLKIMVGLDITNQALITKKHFNELIAVSTPLTKLLNEDMGDGWPGFNKNPRVTRYIWDVLVAAYMIDPSIVTKSEILTLDVITTKGPQYGGVTVGVEKPLGTPIQVLTGLDFDKFFDLFKHMMQG